MAKPLLVEIYADASQYTRTLDKAAGRTKKFGAAAKLAGGLVATGLAVGLEQSVKAAIEAEKTQARLDQAFRAAGIHAKDYEGRIEAIETSTRKLGFTNDDVRLALGTLITATGSYKDSVSQLAVAEDLARFKQVSLADSTRALAMLHAGSTRALKQLGLQIVRVTSAEDAVHNAFKKHSGAAYDAAIATAKLEDKQRTAAATLALVTQKVHGQAEAYSKTAAGSMAQFKAQVENLKVKLGQDLLPALTHITNALSNQVAQLDRTKEKYKFQIDQLKTLKPLYANIGYFVGIAAKDFTDLYHAIVKSEEIQKLPGMIRSLGRAIDDLLGPLVHFWGLLVKLTEKVWEIKIHIPTPHIPSIHVPGIGHVGASGGIVTKPTWSLIGEKGPEALVPLSRAPGASPLGGAGKSTTLVVQVGAAELARVLIDPLRGEVKQLKRRGGSF